MTHCLLFSHRISSFQVNNFSYTLLCIYNAFYVGFCVFQKPFVNFATAICFYGRTVSEVSRNTIIIYFTLLPESMDSYLEFSNVHYYFQCRTKFGIIIIPFITNSLTFLQLRALLFLF